MFRPVLGQTETPANLQNVIPQQEHNMKPNCQISSTSTGEEENRKSVIEGEKTHPPPPQKTTEDPETSL
jgi:hypothetical protein